MFKWNFMGLSWDYSYWEPNVVCWDTNGIEWDEWDMLYVVHHQKWWVNMEFNGIFRYNQL